MNQIEMLWEFQQADMEADNLENEIKRAPNRIALKKNRDFLLEQQNSMKQSQEEVSQMLDRIDIIQEAISKQNSQLELLQEKFKKTPPENLADTKDFSIEAKALIDNIRDYEAEMKRIQSDAQEHERSQKEIIVKYAKVKSEYETQKQEYEIEYKESMKSLDEKKAIAQEKSKGIDASLLEKYQTIKKHCSPPVAQLINDQCGGCYMSLPSVTLRNIKSGEKMIECESCGRMIVQL